MRFASFSLFFLTASFVKAKEEGLQQQQHLLQQQQQKHMQHELSGVRSAAARPGRKGKKNIRGSSRLLLVSDGESEGNNNSNNHHYYYNDNVADKKNAIADVGILFFNSHQYHGSNDNHNLDRVLEEPCNKCGTGDNVCYRASVDTIGACSCNGDYACYKAGKDGGVTIGENSCNGPSACEFLAPNASYNVVVGNGSCIGDVSCYELGTYGNVEIGDGSCIGTKSCDVYGENFPIDTLGKPIKIGNNACNCFECCWNILPGSIVGDGQCNSLEDGCAGTLVKPGSECSSPATNATRGSKKKDKKNSACSSKKNSAQSSKEKSSGADCKGFVCAFSSELVEMCIVGTGDSEPSTQCVSKKDVKKVFKANEQNKCGPCDGV